MKTKKTFEQVKRESTVSSLIISTILATSMLILTVYEIKNHGFKNGLIVAFMLFFLFAYNVIKEAKKLLLILFLPLISFTQLPTSNQGWTINTGVLYEDINTGREADYLTFNTGSSTLLDFRQYEWQSPNYDLINQGCDSLRVTIKVDMQTRATDQVKLFYRIGANSYFKIIPESGIYTYVLPNNIDYFTFNLVTWGGGSLIGKYVRFKSFMIECKNTGLPVTLLSFCAKPAERFNLIHWSTANEINSDYFLLEKSTDCQNWATLDKFYTGFDSNTEKTYMTKDYASTVITYYRLTQVDLNGARTDYGIRSVLNDSVGSDKIVSVFNIMGQDCNDGFRVFRFESGNVLKVW